MIRKIIFKLFLAIISLVFFLFSILYISFIYTDEVIEIFKDEINLAIIKNFPAYESFSYKSIEGNLSQNITIKELSLSSKTGKIEVDKLVLNPYNLSNFYFFIHRIINSIYNNSNQFKLESINLESLKISEKSYTVYFNQIFVNKKEITSSEVKLDYLDNRIKLFGLHLNLGLNENIDLNILNISPLINKRNHLFFKKGILLMGYADKNITIFDCTLNHDFHRTKKNIFNITSYNNNCYIDNIKYYFKYDVDLNLDKGNSKKLLIKKLTIEDKQEFEHINITGIVKLENMYLDLDIKTKKLTFFDYFHSKKGQIDVLGKDYIYEVNFSLEAIKNLVENKIDKLKGQFTFNLQNNNNPLVHFQSPLVMTDKDYKGFMTISDMFDFNDIYNPEIEVRTERINPFKLNQFNQLD